MSTGVSGRKRCSAKRDERPCRGIAQRIVKVQGPLSGAVVLVCKADAIRIAREHDGKPGWSVAIEAIGGAS